MVTAFPMPPVVDRTSWGVKVPCFLTYTLVIWLSYYFSLPSYSNYYWLRYYYFKYYYYTTTTLLLLLLLLLTITCIFTSSGGMSPGASYSCFFKHLADIISNKRVQEYSVTMSWIISFALLRSDIMCLRGNWVNRRPLVLDCHVELVISEGHIATITC